MYQNECVACGRQMIVESVDDVVGDLLSVVCPLCGAVNESFIVAPFDSQINAQSPEGYIISVIWDDGLFSTAQLRKVRSVFPSLRETAINRLIQRFEGQAESVIDFFQLWEAQKRIESAKQQGLHIRVQGCHCKPQ